MEAVLLIAARQHGAISVEQARRADLDARDRRCLVLAGRLVVVEPTVLVAPGSPDTWFRRLQVGLLALGDDAWVSHESAAALLGLDRSAPGALQFTTARESRRKPPAGCTVHTTTRRGAVDVITVGGFRCACDTSHNPRSRRRRSVAGTTRRRARQRDAAAPIRSARSDRATQRAFVAPDVTACVFSTSY